MVEEEEEEEEEEEDDEKEVKETRKADRQCNNTKGVVTIPYKVAQLNFRVFFLKGGLTVELKYEEKRLTDLLPRIPPGCSFRARLPGRPCPPPLVGGSGCHSPGRFLCTGREGGREAERNYKHDKLVRSSS